MLEWGKIDERYYHHGVDRGVMYFKNQAIVWNGITGVEESGNGESTSFYLDGNVYLSDVDATDFSGSLNAYGWPMEMGECLGMPSAAPGVVVDNQKPKRFDFSYRTLVGNGAEGNLFGYQINLVYNALASIGTRTRSTVNDSPGITEFSFDLSCTPVQMPTYRPSAHYIIDTRYIPSASLIELEDILYGDAARMPTVEELYDLFVLGDAITFTTYNHPKLGTVWSAKGSSENLVVDPTDPNKYTIKNVNGNFTDVPAGLFVLRDTP